MSRLAQTWHVWPQNWKLSLFEKVILVNSAMLVVEALAGLWVTSHHIESHHYLIDTGFIVTATLLTLLINILLLRAAFGPLFHLLSTIRAVSAGHTKARATITASTSEVGELASAFNSMLDRLEAARREQTRLILQAQEKEQRRIALELHDEAGQNLTALLVHIEILNQRLQALPETAVTPEAKRQTLMELQRLNGLAQYTLDSIRVLAQQLRPSVLDDLGLLSAFRWLAEDSTQRLNLQVEIDTTNIDQTAPRLPIQHETVLFRITQESLTNIARHARTQRAWISLTRDQQHIYLRVRDDGCGFDTARFLTSSGLVGMQERAESLQGKLSISSYSGHGTTIEACLPLPATQPEVNTEKSVNSSKDVIHAY